MGEDRLEEAASLLAQARLEGKTFGSLPERCRPANETEAYAVQRRLHALLENARGSRLVGRKIGCTTDVMQRYLGIDSPCAGGLYDNGVYRTPAQLEHADFRRVGVECEIAVRLSADLPPADRGYDRDMVGSAVESCMAAIEIVDDRYLDYRALDTPTLIADDFFHAGAVLGPEVETWRSLDLAALESRMIIDDEIAGEGMGAAILGHPLNALAWLADAEIARGGMLKTGDLVLLGSLVQTRWIDAGTAVEIAVDELGGARVDFI